MASKEIVVNSVNYEKQNGLNVINQKSRNKRLFTWKTVALICVINASIGLFGNGSFVGWTSYADSHLYKTLSVQQQKAQQEWQMERIFSAIALTAALAPLIIHQIWHLIGTKRFILIANFLMIVAWILIMLYSDNYYVFWASRAIGGLAVGTLHFLIPLYITDIVPVHQKPLWHSIMQLQFGLGILSQYILSLFKSFLIINLLPALMSTIMFLTFFFMPESPRFLSMRRNPTAAKDILTKFKMDERDVQSDLQLWTSSHYKKNYVSVFKEHFGIIYAIPVFGLHIFEQLIGAVPILFYLEKIFELTDTDYAPEILAIICGSVYALSTLLPRYFTNKNGLIWSTNLMAAILGLLGFYCHLFGSLGPNHMKDYRYIPLICLALVYMLFATGPQRFTNEYAELVIPKKCYFTIRCMLTTTSWLIIYVMTRILPQLIRHVGVGWVFWFMAAMCELMSVFVRLFVIDVSQKSEKFRLVDNTSSSSSSSGSSEGNGSESNSEA